MVHLRVLGVKWEKTSKKPQFIYQRNCLLYGLHQGQARGCGRITQFLNLPTWGHDFPLAIVTQPVGIFQTQGCHMKDMAIIFSKTPFALLLVEWVGQSELSKSSTF